jgi:hypothetical protein
MRSKFAKFPVLLAVTITTTMSTLSFAGELTTVRYSKETLQKHQSENFIKATDLSDILASKLNMLAVTVTQRQAGSNSALHSVAAGAPEISKARYLRRLSTLAVDPDSQSARGDTDKLRVTLSQQSRKATEVKFKEAFPVFDRIKNGLVFKLDLARPSSLKPKSNTAPDIRYGLVEADILPASDPIPVAGLGDISDMSSGFARPAKVVYTIDRLDGQENRKVFTETEAGDDAQVQNTSIWNKRPSMKMEVKIDAADQNATVSDQVGQGTIPGARVTLKQADGFVTTQFALGGKSSKKSMTTELKAPLYGEMSVARKYNHKSQAIQTSALNILGNSSLPRVNIFYANLDKKYKGEWIVKKDRFEYNVTAEPRQGYGSGGDNKFGKVGDKVSFGLGTTF